MNAASAAEPIRTIGRYALFDEIASGGMATVHLGRLLGPVGFSRTVAIKRLHAHFAKDPEFSAGFVDEARLAARIHHPNVVPIIDVLHDEGELSLVMDYVEGDSLAKLLRIAASTDVEVPLPIVTAIVCGALYGLHAAHEAVDEAGEPMHIVHRDISPQNILVGSDGVPRILDFGVAKAAQRLQTTADGQVKGKIAYMAPEQIRQATVSRQTDVYAMGVVLWEALAGKRLFTSENHANLMSKVLAGAKLPPSSMREDCPAALDALVMRALSPEPRARFETAREMAAHIQKVLTPAPPTDVGDWVNALARDALTDRRRVVKRVESRELPTEGKSAEDFISRPNNEDLLTVVDRGRRFSGDDGTTQAVTTGRLKARVESSRIFLPLVLGLAMVMGVIVTLLVRSRPTLENSDQKNISQSAGTLLPSEESSPEAQIGNDSSPSGDPPSVVKPAESDSTPEPDPTPEPSQATRPVKPPPSTKPPPASPPCPKFIEDEQGIRRINRKCWQ